MRDPIKHLQDLGTTITKICEVSGAAGVSIGVTHKGVKYTEGYGFRDVEKKLRPDENTIYHLASLTKSFTAAAIGILAEESHVQWNDPITNVLPDFHHSDPTIAKKATVLDFLSHRTGLATKNALWAQDGADLLLKPNDLYPTVSYLEVVQDLGSTWLYNNWGYNLGAEIIEKVSNCTWGSFLSERIFRPLGLENTTAEEHIYSENVAKGYLASPEGQPYAIESPRISAGTIMQGANGIKSNVKDLLSYYSAFLSAAKHQLWSPDCPNSKGTLKDLRTLLTSHILLDRDSNYGQSYGAGWVLAHLPAPLGAVGINGMFVPEMPVVGKGSQKREIWYHNGSLVGFFSSVHIIPDTDTVIVVLVNSLAKNDCADWIGQLLVEALLNNPEKNDYVGLAQRTAERYDRMWGDLQDGLKDYMPPKRSIRPLEEYTGRYYNLVRHWFIEVTAVGTELYFRFQGLPTQTHRLKHCGTDTFSWLLTEDESMRLGRWPDLDIQTYVIRFEADDSGRIAALRWEHDPDVPDGETFMREPAPAKPSPRVATNPQENGNSSAHDEL